MQRHLLLISVIFALAIAGPVIHRGSCQGGCDGGVGGLGGYILVPYGVGNGLGQECTCPANEVRLTADSCCELCDNSTCTSRLENGCFCVEGFCRNSSGVCVPIGKSFRMTWNFYRNWPWRYFKDSLTTTQAPPTTTEVISTTQSNSVTETTTEPSFVTNDQETSSELPVTPTEQPISSTEAPVEQSTLPDEEGSSPAPEIAPRDAEEDIGIFDQLSEGQAGDDGQNCKCCGKCKCDCSKPHPRD